MQGFDYDCVAYDASHYCVGCCPVDLDCDEVHPIFATEELDTAAVCDVCGEIHDYMSIIGDDDDDDDDCEEVPIVERCVTKSTRAGRDGKRIMCPHCGYIAKVYNFAWSALGCECGRAIKKTDYILVHDYILV